MHGTWIGLPLLFVIAQDFRRASFAALGLLIGEALRLLLRIEDRPGAQGCLKVNALLATLAVSWLLPGEGLSPAVQLGLAALAALLAAVLAAAFVRMLKGTGLPPLVGGYVAVAGTLFIIFPDWALNAAVTTDWGALPVTFGDWLTGFLRMLGAFLFAPDAASGFVIAATILFWSRTMFLAGLVGWLAGLLTGLALSGLGVLFYWLPAAYNFFLVGMALGSVYFLPGWGSLAAAALGGCLAAFGAVGLQHFLDFSAAAYLPLPLCLTVWVGIAALQSAARNGPLRPNRRQEIRPEDAWWASTLEIAKWGDREDLLMVPVEGAVEVTQGFSGQISHLGRWCHALDFQRPCARERSSGRAPSIFGSPVRAPAPGIVERVQNSVPDNARGTSNFAENWGNHVVIRLDAGGWALVGHLGKGSVAVRPGERVDFGSLLGEVGNSGRSPEPHLHLQVQEGPEPGAATVPFRLANYLYAEHPGEPLVNWAAAAVPAEGTRLKASTPNPGVHRLLAGIAPGRALWSFEAHGSLPAGFRPDGRLTSLRIEMSLDVAGRLVMTSREGARLIARFDADAWRIVELAGPASPFLRLMALALPSVPYAAEEGVKWQDFAIIPPSSRLDMLRFSLMPYRRENLTALRSCCLQTPSDEAPRLIVETIPAKPAARLPDRIRCELREIDGPCALAAEFPHGRISYSLYAFSPTMPHPVGSAAD